MAVNSSLLSDVTVNGTLQNYSREIVSKGKFHVYDEKGKFQAFGKTSKDGKFTIKLRNQPQDQQISLCFRLCKETNHFQGESELDKRIAKDLAFMNQRSEVEQTTKQYWLLGPILDVGTISMDTSYKTEIVPSSYMLDLITPKILAQIKGAKATIFHAVDFFNLQNPEAFQKAYAVSSIPLTANATWKLLLNGICPLYFKTEDNCFVAEVNWDNYEFKTLQSLANVKIWFKPDKAAKEPPEIIKINVEFRETTAPSNRHSELKTYFPSSTNFEEGLRIANSAFFLYGETVFHLAIGHVYGAQVADAAHDFLQGTKFGELLLPHCDYICKITEELGKDAIFGPTGILNSSGLSLQGIAHLIDDTIATIDPFTFEPRTPVSEDHYFAKAQQLHYGIVKESVTEFITDNWDEIVKDWELVHQFFTHLFKKSPTHRFWEGSPLDSQKWVNTNEMGGLTDPMIPQREKSKAGDQDVKSIRPIAKNPLAPNPSDKEMIIKFATHFIHLVTLWHSWIHHSQFEVSSLAPHAMDINFSPITLSNYGKGPFGGIKGDAAKIQSMTAQTFAGFNEEHYALIKSPKVYPGLIERILQAKEKYLAVGIPVQKIAYSTVI